MCNVSGLITGIYKGYTWQAPLGELPYVYQTCSTHLRSDLQSRLSISQPALLLHTTAIPTEEFSCRGFFTWCLWRKLSLGVIAQMSLQERGILEGAFLLHSVTSFFLFTMTASFPISQPSFRPIKLQKPFVQDFICCEATSCLCLSNCTILCRGIEQKREGRTQCFL